MKVVLTFIISMNMYAAPKADYYQERFGHPDLYSKITNNTGDGFEDLYGTRNMRVVLKGLLYRGGGNNAYHRTNKRPNMNPLPKDGLLNICKEGFKTSIYLYTKNYERSVKKMDCRFDGEKNRVNYLNYEGLRRGSHLYKVLEIVYKESQKDIVSPIYAHCWNGWHASGYVSAASLIQFCEMSNEDAVKYWDTNTDGRNTNPRYERIREKLRLFKPFEEFKISKELQEKICF